MQDDEDFNNYDGEVIDKEEIEGTDIKINPDFYIHKALIAAQKALIKDNIKEGFFQYRLCIEHIEVLCKAANMLGEDYEKDIKDFQDKEEYKKETDNIVKSMKLANKKLGLIMASIFTNKTATFNLKA